MNVAAGFDLFAKQLDETNTSGYKSNKLGGSLRMSYPLSENIWMTNYYTFSRDEMTDVVSTASAAIKEACGWGGGDPAFLYTNGGLDSGSCQKGAYYTSLVGTSVSWDMRNHPKNPTKGLFFQVAGDFAGLGGDVQYVRLSAEGRAYYPLTDKITFVGRAIGGDIEGWGGQDVRLLDLFFKGGETVRGFNRSGYGPRDLITSDALGGSRYWAATAEVRFPLPLIPDDLGISGAVFADAGSLWGAGAGAKRLANRRQGGVGRQLLGSVVGGRQHPLELAGGSAPHRLRQGDHQTRLRQGTVRPLRRTDQVLILTSLRLLRRERSRRNLFGDARAATEDQRRQPVVFAARLAQKVLKVAAVLALAGIARSGRWYSGRPRTKRKWTRHAASRILRQGRALLIGRDCARDGCRDRAWQR